ncbi:MAG: tRNA preQ1(34) S-adenosylmethionine ribosyltransferase-isomerase QueA [Defluviitaleaceae bacterium]|nr:tRNA preQ1(34) S-adenosylmethionine ribosyltransferase-isomerase QueA [Defluviitaleaceae bacterium]
MKKSDFYYELPKELIAQIPLENRDGSRLLTLSRADGSVEHKKFTDILDILNPEDCLVINNTKVIPARLMGRRTDGDGEIEFLLLNNKGDNIWEVLVNPGKWAKVGHKAIFGNILQAEVLDIVEGGNRLVKFEYDESKHGIFEEVLDKLGEMPLPPYITEKLADANRYQTVYAKEAGSAAAPTAGLHFTEELLEQIRAKGVSIAHVTLHVGLGTFRPVKTDNIQDHEMHSEFYVLEPSQADIINTARDKGGRVIAVGTTSVRTLESCVNDNGVLLVPNSGYTGIFIYPGHIFKAIDGLITNFHLPESTLVMLVSALSTREYILAAYAAAVEERYRFFSFGDAMLIM